MATPKKYAHDRIILVLLSVVAFLGIGNSLLVTLRLLSNRSNSYIVQYRSSLGPIGAFKTGTIDNLAAFIVFMLLIVIGAFVLSRRIYPLRRHLAIVVLVFSVTLLAFAAVVSNALLGLR